MVINNEKMTIKDKSVGMAGSVSGMVSVMGSWQVCHNLCLGLIALLSVIGITVVGMPLMFLQRVALPFWIIAVSLLAIALYFYFKKGCISQKLILFNLGVIIAAIPFQSLQSFLPVFWIIGGSLVALSVFLFIKDKIKR